MNLPIKVATECAKAKPFNDFQLQVLRHRQALASFARRRARKTKKKWALKYDELYYNGRVFVFDEDSNRVVAATSASIAA